MLLEEGIGMVSEFLRRPRVLKGALVAYGSQLIPTVPSVIVFQYNPENLTRVLRGRTASGRERTHAEACDVLQVTGPPEEQITMTVTLDATDQLEFPDQNPVTVMTGLHPALAALELSALAACIADQVRHDVHERLL